MDMLRIPGGAYQYLYLDDARLLKSCRVDVYSASGPGGQKRNRKYSAVRITHHDTKVSAIAEESRSQQENKSRALRRLRKAIALGIRPQETSVPEIRTALSYEVSLQELFAIKQKNPSYPLLCAAVLDAVDAAGGKVAEAARSLCVSTGRLNKLLSRDPDMLTAVNAVRCRNDLKPLRP